MIEHGGFPAFGLAYGHVEARAALYADGDTDLEAARDLPCHTGLVMLSDRGHALGRVTPGKRVRLVRGDREAFGIKGRSAE